MQVEKAPLRSRIEAFFTQRCSLYLLQAPRCDTFEGDASHALADMGPKQIKVAFAKCRGVGSAPVTPDGCTCQAHGQSQRQYLTTASVLKEAMADRITDEELPPSSRGALNAGKVVYVHDESGSGKTYLAENLIKTLQSHIRIPRAVFVDGEVIRVFDSAAHRAVEEVATAECGLNHDAVPEGRRVPIKRPVAITAGELARPMLECECDSLSHVTPPQTKANDDIFVVVVLGHQWISPSELLNRRVVPLDRHSDYLGLHTGGKYEVQIDVTVIFSTDLTPDALRNPAFSRFGVVFFLSIRG